MIFVKTVGIVAPPTAVSWALQLAVDIPIGDIAKQVPALAVLAFIVWLFLSQQEKSAKIQEEGRKDREETLRHIGQDCHEHSKQLTETMVKALDANTEAMNTHSRILRQHESTLERVARAVDAN